MKKALKIISAIIGLLLLATLVLPVLFKDELINEAKKQAEKHIEADVKWEDMSLSLLSNFPNFTFTVEGIEVKNNKEFKEITLAKIGEIKFSIDLMSVLSGKTISINTIELNNSNFYFSVLSNQKANWEIVKSKNSSESPQEMKSENSKAFEMNLNNLSISNANLTYNDHYSQLFAGVENYNLTLSGDLTESSTELNIHTFAKALTVKKEGIKYLNKAKLDFRADIAADLDKMKFTMEKNTFQLNDVLLGINGWLQMNEDSYNMDLDFNTNEPSFKSVLSLIPAIYLSDFSEIQTKGSFGILGMIKGTYHTEGEHVHTPSYNIDFFIKDASFNYPDLPGSANNIQLKLGLKSSGGSLDNTIIDLKTFHMDLSGNPFEMHLQTKTPISDPYISAKFDGTIDLNKIKEIIPLEKGDKLGGTITTDITMEGNLSTIEKEDYENFKANGSLLVKALDYQSSDIDYNVKIQNAHLDFSPKKVHLKTFDCTVGKGDYHATGIMTNFIPYALTDAEELKGIFNYTSKYIDINEFLSDDSTYLAYEAAVAAGEIVEEPLEVYPLPENIFFTLNSKIKEMLYENMHIYNTTGNITLRNQRVDLTNGKMEMLGGTVSLEGYYETTDPEKPTMDYAMKMEDVDIQKTAKTFNTMAIIAPILEKSHGFVDMDIVLFSALDKEYMPEMNSLSGAGKITTKSVKVKDFPMLEKLAAALKIQGLDNLELNNKSVEFAFKDGKVTIEPFDIKMGESKNIAVNLKGWNAFDNTLEWFATFNTALKHLSSSNPSLVSMASQAGISPNEQFKIPVKIHGTSANPIFDIEWSIVAEQIKNKAGGAIKTQIINQIQDQVSSAKKELKKKAEDIKSDVKEEVKAKANKILADAEKAADKVRKEGKNLATATRRAGRENGQKIIKEAGNHPVKKKIAEKSAKAIEQKANKKAQNIENTANQKADKIMEDARNKADALLNNI